VPCDEQAILDAVLRLSHSGAADVVVSRASGATIGYLDGRFYRTTGPKLDAMDHRGSGDTMTAALAVARFRGESPAETLRTAAAAGAANVTRHGLGAPDVELIGELMRLTETGPISGDPGPTPDRAGAGRRSDDPDDTYV
jgi:1-phosphofructokinase